MGKSLRNKRAYHYCCRIQTTDYRCFQSLSEKKYITNRWGTVETVSDFIFGRSKIAADGDCSHEIKRHLLLGRKVMTNLDSILKSRKITLSTKVHLVKPVGFPVVMYGCESWTWRRVSTEELMLLNCAVGEDSWESFGLQGDPTSPFWRRSALGVLWRKWC